MSKEASQFWGLVITVVIVAAVLHGLGYDIGFGSNRKIVAAEKQEKVTQDSKPLPPSLGLDSCKIMHHIPIGWEEPMQEFKFLALEVEVGPWKEVDEELAVRNVRIQGNWFIQTKGSPIIAFIP